MEFPTWATPGENRRLYGRARANGADELTLSDLDATTGFLEGKSGRVGQFRFRFKLLITRFYVTLDDFTI